MVDISPELRRCIKVAAAQKDLSMNEYIGRILEETVPRETFFLRKENAADSIVQR